MAGVGQHLKAFITMSASFIAKRSHLSLAQTSWEYDMLALAATVIFSCLHAHTHTHALGWI